MVAENNTEIRKAVDTLYELSEDDIVRAQYEWYEKCVRDHDSQIEGYYLDGRAEGLAEGRSEGLAEGEAKGRSEGEKRVLDMFKQGLSVEEVEKRLRQD